MVNADAMTKMRLILSRKSILVKNLVAKELAEALLPLKTFRKVMATT